MLTAAKDVISSKTAPLPEAQVQTSASIRRAGGPWHPTSRTPVPPWLRRNHLLLLAQSHGDPASQRRQSAPSARRPSGGSCDALGRAPSRRRPSLHSWPTARAFVVQLPRVAPGSLPPLGLTLPPGRPPWTLPAEMPVASSFSPQQRFSSSAPHAIAELHFPTRGRKPKWVYCAPDQFAHCYWPVRPSMHSRNRSAWPTWRAYSSTRWTTMLRASISCPWFSTGASRSRSA